MSPCPTQPCQLHKGTSYSINVTFASSKYRFLRWGAGAGGSHLCVPLRGQEWGRVAGEGSGWEEVAGEEEHRLVVFSQPPGYVKEPDVK